MKESAPAPDAGGPGVVIGVPGPVRPAAATADGRPVTGGSPGVAPTVAVSSGDGPVGDVPGGLPTTGDDAVDEALRTLGGLHERPLREHVQALESVHGALSDRLAEGRS